MKELRGLDIDDLLLLCYMYDGMTVTQTGKALNVTQPAISQRIKKMEDMLGFRVLRPNGKSKTLTLEASALAYAAKVALETICRSLPTKKETSLAV
jgi:DNA-binding transcriptional LysR family regulator